MLCVLAMDSNLCQQPSAAYQASWAEITEPVINVMQYSPSLGFVAFDESSDLEVLG
jgi:hypothetical protein